MGEPGRQLLSRSGDGESPPTVAPVIGVYLSRDAALGVVTGPRDLVPHGGLCAEISINDTSVAGVVTAVAAVANRLTSHLPSRDGVQIGLALGGHVDPTSRAVVLSNDFRDRECWWTGVPLADHVSDLTGLDVHLVNDANALVLNDHLRDGATASDNIAAVLVGDYGLGCGLIINGQLVLGARGVSGEIGHLPVSSRGEPCRCGGSHCLERVVTLSAIDARLAAIPESGSQLSVDAFESAETAVFERAGRALGYGLVAVINLLNPRAIFIHAPSAIIEQSVFSQAAKDTAALCSFSDAGTFCPIYTRELNPVAIARGAAAYVHSR